MGQSIADGGEVVGHKPSCFFIGKGTDIGKRGSLLVQLCKFPIPLADVRLFQLL